MRFQLNPKSPLAIVLLTALVAVGPLSTDVYLPSLPSIGAYFGATVSQTQLTLSAFMAGFAVATLFYGALSDRFGRRPVLLAGMTLFAVASFGCMTAETIHQLIGWRFLQAVGGCAAPVLSRAMVRDLFAREDAARVMSYMGAAMALAPGIGPILGGWVLLHFEWQGNFAVLGGMGSLLTALAFVFLRETNQRPDVTATDPLRMARNARAILRHPPFLGYALMLGMAYGSMFSFISGGSFLLIGTYGVKPEHFGFLFLFVVLGFTLGALTNAKLTKRKGILAMLGVGVLVSFAAGAIGLALAVMNVQALPAIIGPVALLFFACAFIFPNATAGAMSPFPQMAGLASSISAFVQMGGGAAIGYVVGRILDGTALPMFAVILIATVMGAALFFGWVKPAERRINLAKALEP